MNCLASSTGGKCPTHPNMNLTKMCISKSCLEPLCQLCVTEHTAMHAQLGTVPDLRKLNEVNESYLYKLQNRQKVLEESYNRSMASSMVKGYVDDFFRKLRVDDRHMVSHKGNVAKSNVSGLLEVMLQDNKAELAPDFKHRLYEFLARNLKGMQDTQGINPQFAEGLYANGNVGRGSTVYASLPTNLQHSTGAYQPPQQGFANSYPTTSNEPAQRSRFPQPQAYSNQQYPQYTGRAP